MTPTEPAVRGTSPGELRVVAQVLATAFADDPVIAWLLPDGRHRDTLFYALARWQHGQAGGADVAVRGGRVLGAALWDAPGYRQPLRSALASLPWFVRALRLRSHYGNALEIAFHKNRPAGRFWYLAQLGAGVQGQGIGSALLASRLARVDGPAYLESSNERNVPLYERFGFRVTGEIHLPYGGPTCWMMYRP